MGFQGVLAFKVPLGMLRLASGLHQCLNCEMSTLCLPENCSVRRVLPQGLLGSLKDVGAKVGSLRANMARIPDLPNGTHLKGAGSGGHGQLSPKASPKAGPKVRHTELQMQRH